MTYRQVFLNFSVNYCLTVSVNLRISAVCEKRKIKQSDLVLNGFGSKQTVSLIFNEKQKPSVSFLEMFVRFIPDLNVRWFITGEGEMFGEETVDINISSGQTMISDNIAQYGKNSTMQKSGNSEELEALKKELEYKNRENEILKEENDKKDQIINKLLDK